MIKKMFAFILLMFMAIMFYALNSNITENKELFRTTLTIPARVLSKTSA